MYEYFYDYEEKLMQMWFSGLLTLLPQDSQIFGATKLILNLIII